MQLSRRSWFVVVSTSMLAGTGLAVPPGTVLASDLRMTVEKPHFTCETHAAGFSHVVFRAGRQRLAKSSLPCCDGQLGCAQFLSTSTVLHASRRHHS